MSEEERDWKEEGKALYNIYRRRGYQKEVAFDMAQQEIVKRKVECEYPVKTEDAGEKVKSKTLEIQKKRTTK